MHYARAPETRRADCVLSLTFSFCCGLWCSRQIIPSALMVVGYVEGSLGGGGLVTFWAKIPVFWICLNSIREDESIPGFFPVLAYLDRLSLKCCAVYDHMQQHMHAV